MPIVTCKSCSHEFTAPSDLIGMNTTCPGCQAHVWVEPPPRAKPVPPRARVVGNRKALLFGVGLAVVILLGFVVAGGLYLFAAGPTSRMEGERWGEEDVAKYLKRQGAVADYGWEPGAFGTRVMVATVNGTKVRIGREYDREEARRYGSVSSSKYVWGRFIFTVLDGPDEALEPIRRALH